MADTQRIIGSLDVKAPRNLFLKFKRELQLYRNILADSRTPRLSKVLLGLAVAYAVMPLDLIPDFIPVLGHLDDAIIIPVLVFLALKTIPRSLLEEHRQALSKGKTI
jgi:uncharacterized membrane protein YkvA (DUF1232 family)